MRFSDWASGSQRIVKIVHVSFLEEHVISLCSDETLHFGWQFGLADWRNCSHQNSKRFRKVLFKFSQAYLAGDQQEASQVAAMEFDHDQLDAKDKPSSEKLTPAQLY